MYLRNTLHKAAGEGCVERASLSNETCCTERPSRTIAQSVAQASGRRHIFPRSWLFNGGSRWPSSTCRLTADRFCSLIPSKCANCLLQTANPQAVHFLKLPRVLLWSKTPSWPQYLVCPIVPLLTAPPLTNSPIRFSNKHGMTSPALESRA